MNEAGLALIKLGYTDFAHFIRILFSRLLTVIPCALLKTGYLTLVTERPKAVPLIARLVEVFPPFNDTAVYKGRKVFIIKKAQLLAADLHRRFKVRSK